MLGDKGVDRRTVQKWVVRRKILNKYRDLIMHLINVDVVTNG